MKKLILAPALILMVSLPSFGIGLICKDVFTPDKPNPEGLFMLEKLRIGENIERIKNGLNKLKPKDLSLLLRITLPSPHKLHQEFKDLFQAQKLIDPENPHNFPVFKYFREEIDIAIRNTEKEIEQLIERGAHIAMEPTWVKGKDSRRSWRSSQKKMMRDLLIGQEYLRQVLEDLRAIKEAGEVGYLDWLKLSSYYSRAMGYFDLYNLKLDDRYMLMVERRIAGYKRHHILKEFERYKNGDFSIIGQNPSLNRSIGKATQYFEKDFWKKDELRFVLLPSHAYLNMPVFHYLMFKDIYIIGLTPKPLRADGFNRPPGLFFLHDIVHAALIHWTKSLYLKRNNITTVEERALDAEIDKWFAELEFAIQETPDRHIRIIRERTAFNIHHDRGFPLVPSVFMALQQPPPTLQSLYRLLSKWGAHDLHIDATVAEVRDSFEWLKNFWAPYAAREREILGRDLVARKEPM